MGGDQCQNDVLQLMCHRVNYVPVLSVDDVVNFILCCTARRSLTRETENDEEGRVMMQKRDVSAPHTYTCAPTSVRMRDTRRWLLSN